MGKGLHAISSSMRAATLVAPLQALTAATPVWSASVVNIDGCTGQWATVGHTLPKLRVGSTKSVIRENDESYLSTLPQ